MSEVNLLQTNKPLVYAIDAWSANQPEKTGVEMYAFQLIQAMKQHTLLPNERVILYSPKKLEGPLADLPQGWEEKIIPWKTKGWMQGRMSIELALHRPNVFFVPSQGLPRRFPFASYPIVTTVHDLGFFRRPDLYDASSRHRLGEVTERSVRVAQRIITVSEFSKKELIDLLHVDESRITVTQLAADTKTYKQRSQEEVNQVLSKYRLGHHFFLFVGRMDKKKNMETVLRAFEEFKTARGMGDPYELVLVGGPGYGFDYMKKMMLLLPHKEQLRVLGYVSDLDVSALMNAASAFLFPSWYEGFGLPNLEAMASGCPLITSDIPVHHEVCKDAAYYVTPEDPRAWARALQDISSNPEKRKVFIEQGLAVVQTYSWSDTAKKTWEVLRSVV